METTTVNNNNNNNNSHKSSSLERVVSQKALQLSTSFPCQICVVGFLCGICLTSFFTAVITCFGTFPAISFSPFPITTNNKSLNVRERIMYSDGDENKVSQLYSKWRSDLLSNSIAGVEGNVVPPHLENCKLSVKVNQRLDRHRRVGNESFPPWTIWKGVLDDLPISIPSSKTDEYDNEYYRDRLLVSQGQGAYPPWITGSDAENYPLTRKVQRDIWVHQHPLNCSDDNVKFLVADWERLPGFGIGAQFAGMCGLLAIAVKEKRVLVTNYYNRADHDACKGSSRSSWSCYFFPETSLECRKRALELMGDKVAWEKGIITGKDNYSSRNIWSGSIPRKWGNPWSIMQPTTEINGSLIIRHRKMDRRWWRAQAIRYLMRFQSEYTCNLMNIARHAAFGWEAAKMVIVSSSQDSIVDVKEEERRDIAKYVWSNKKPWVPRPLLSMHVRMGDKACEMKVVGFEEYMHLAKRLRNRFPHLNSVWLSTEMQDVIDRSKIYRNWKFYYTNVTRQRGNMTMATYERSLGRETSTNYPIVNFLMATEADFFIGALGSTWCFLIDGMRNTGGKVTSGYLSVNKDRFW
ncbi:hypothetical protein BUALT_Bualt06G0044700 [Buddleja alternifolia]|uniref:Alpha-(1,6)-fucosyltransferase n=1 Tax=Buddleja alternifolia TaxID=168488 RepID=A0AAV6XCU6_9LAMI|nr:hypothetical protein BUALT_Bualt06G0044700 [Buddleja alternifolia]